MTASFRPDPPARETGFVLAGVVMFMMALTVLALSLFSLSGFEGRMSLQQLDEDQAYYSAIGGLERAKFALVRMDSLAAVKSNLPVGDVVYARAMQGTDSTGKVNWMPDSIITLRVLAIRGTARRLLEAKFSPLAGPMLYKHLFTSYDTVSVTAADPSKVVLTGNVWQNNPDTSWSTKSSGSHSVYKIGKVPRPSLDSFMASDWAQAAGPVSPGQSHDYHLDSGNGGWGFYKNAYSSGLYSLDDTLTSNPPPTVYVRGKVVWMFDRGVRFAAKLKVEAAATPGTNALVIVAKAGLDPSDPEAAIWLRGSIESTSGQYCPVILVTDGHVRIEHATNPTQSSTVDYISIFAGDVFISGPTGSGKRLKFTHYTGATEDRDDTGLIDQLADLGLLPNATLVTSSRFTFIPGSWREITAGTGQ